MNTAEKVVEAYFRLCKKCFTLSDVKVVGGNNRQIDLLAYRVGKGEQYHVETSVTHCQNWCPDAEELMDNFDRKFFGIPPKREGDKTDHAKGKKYYQNISETYKEHGLNPGRIQRVWVCWSVADRESVQKEIEKYCNKRSVRINPIKILTFMEDIIPALSEKVSTSNYEDDILRLLSLSRQYGIQKKNKPAV